MSCSTAEPLLSGSGSANKGFEIKMRILPSLGHGMPTGSGDRASSRYLFSPSPLTASRAVSGEGLHLGRGSDEPKQ